MKKIICVAGTRPEAIKMAPVMEAFQKINDVELKFVWSGQHYDYGMSRIFFEELNLPEPDLNLDVRSGSHAEQTAEVMLGLDRVFKENRPDFVLAEGDTNTVVATGLTTIKEHIPFGHVEAGLRSYDRVMPEEINRCVAGVCAELNFAPTPNAAINLLYEGVPPGRVFITGNTIVDVVKKVVSEGRKVDVSKKFALNSGSRNILLTLHRSENVDSRQRLTEIVRALVSLNQDARIIFPAHPRTVKKLAEFGLLNELRSCRNLLLTEPIGYVEFLNLLSMADLVLTDSGGVQEEAMLLGVPAITLRCNTERPETVWYGWNVLAGVERDQIVKTTQSVLNDSCDAKDRRRPLKYLMSIAGRNRHFEEDAFSESPLGDGKSGRRIAETVVANLDKRLRVASPKYMQTGSAIHLIKHVDRRVTVSEINESGEALVTLVYDPDGKPLFPYPELCMEPGYFVRLFGEFCVNRKGIIRSENSIRESSRTG